MKRYELMAIIRNTLSEKEAEDFAKKRIVERIEKDYKGKVTFEDFWGPRGFAYKIKQDKWGYYFVVQFDFPVEKIQEFKRELALENNILRMMITIVDLKCPPPRKYAELKAEYEAQEKKRVENKNPHLQEKLTTVEEKKEEKAESKAPTSEVDKKLEEMVDATTSEI